MIKIVNRSVFGTLASINGEYSFLTPYIDEFGNEIKRTKHEYPYSYDGFVTYRGGKNSEVKSTIYSDRLSQWDAKKTKKLKQKHFNSQGDYFYDRTPEQIESFLSEYLSKDIKLILIMEYCNVSSGYPVWRFDYAYK